MFWTNILIVFLGTACVMYVQPRLLFSKFLTNKTASYKLFFSAGSSILLWNFIFIIMGSLSILNTISANIVFYSSLVIALGINVFFFMKNARIYDYQNKFYDIRDKFSTKDTVKKVCFYVALIVIFAILFIHFSDYVRTYNNHGFSDMPRHEKWITQLSGGKLYSDGVYPFGMHFIIFIISSAFGINVTTVNLLIGPLINILLFIAIVKWLKEIFKNDSSILVVFLLYIVISMTLNNSTNLTRMVYDGVNRLSWTLPQEFVFWAIFVSAKSLIQLLKTKDSLISKENLPKLILFAITVGVTFAVHYYTVVFQFIVCVSIVLVFITKLNIDKIKWISLAILGAVIFVGSTLLLSYLRFSKWAYSVNWAASVPSNEAPVANAIASVPGTTATGNSYVSGGGFIADTIVPLFFQSSWFWVLIIMLLYSLTLICIALYTKAKINLAFWSCPIAFVILFVMYAAPSMGLPRLIESYRFINLLYFLNFATLTIGYDLTISLAQNKPVNKS